MKKMHEELTRIYQNLPEAERELKMHNLRLSFKDLTPIKLQEGLSKLKKTDHKENIEEVKPKLSSLNNILTISDANSDNQLKEKEEELNNLKKELESVKNSEKALKETLKFSQQMQKDETSRMAKVLNKGKKVSGADKLN